MQPLNAESSLRFEPGLEAEYARTRLLNGRTLIRMASLLNLVVVCLRAGDLALGGAGMSAPVSSFTVILLAIVLVASALLAVLAWSPLFERRYLPVANLVVPARNTLVAIAVGILGTRGQTELLIVLPAMVLGPFFFLGLHLRPALVSVALTIGAFAAAAFAAGMAATVMLRACTFLVVTAAISAVAAWQLERQSRRVFVQGRVIAQLAEHDALTGLKNRRVFDEHLARLWRQAIDDKRALAILLIDVDHFKAYNDRHGHQAGDDTLQRVARAIQSQVRRPLDVLSRYGGEEFALLLYDADGRQALEVAERIRRAVEAIAIKHKESSTARVVTVSIGIAAVQPAPNRGPDGALQLADEAMYAAKANGRNRVHLAADSRYSDLQTGVFVQQTPAADVGTNDGRNRDAD